MGVFSFLGSLFGAVPDNENKDAYTTSRRYTTNFGQFPQWLEVIGRHEADMQQKDVVSAQNPRFKKWLEFIASIQNLPLHDKINQVNQWVNEVIMYRIAQRGRYVTNGQLHLNFLPKAAIVKTFLLPNISLLRCLGLHQGSYVW